jgi:hypothetical protein
LAKLTTLFVCEVRLARLKERFNATNNVGFRRLLTFTLARHFRGNDIEGVILDREYLI